MIFTFFLEISEDFTQFGNLVKNVVKKTTKKKQTKTSFTRLPMAKVTRAPTSGLA